MSDTNLFSPVKLGSYSFLNRMVMAPMTRLRAVGSIPNALMADYYSQRASAGLVTTECTMVSPLKILVTLQSTEGTKTEALRPMYLKKIKPFGNCTR